MKRIYGMAYALLSSAAFGFMPIFAKIAYNHGSNPLTVLSLRFLLAAIMLLFYFHIANIEYKVNRKQLKILFLVGVLGYTSTGLTLFFSYNYISVGLATTMHFIYPAIVIVLNYFLYKEPITRNKIAALLLSMLGVYILVGVKAQGIQAFGTVIALLSGFTFAGCVMGMNHPEVKQLDNTVTVFYFSVFAGSALLLYTLFSGNLVFNVNIYTSSSLLGISLISTIISITLFVKAIKIIGSSSTSILGTFEPIVSIIMGIILFKEPLTIVMIIGTLLILLSVVLLSNKD